MPVSGELELLRGLVAASPAAIIGRTVEGTITHWNAAAERLYGYRAQEVIGRPITLLAPEGWDPDDFPSAARRIARGELLDPVETVRRRADGTLVDVEVTVAPVRDAEGRVIGAVVVATDITERRAAQRVESEFAALLEEAQTIARLGSWEVHPDQGRQTWTRQVDQLFGIPHDPARYGDSSWLRRLVHPEDLPAYEALLDRVHRTGEAGEVEYRVLRPDGDVRLLHSRARRVESDAGVKLVGTVQDVTEIRRLERETAATRDLFAGVLDAATEIAIIAVDTADRITVFNRGAELMLGYTAAELIGRHTPQVFHDPGELARRAAELGLPVGLEVLAASARAGRPETRDWTYVRKDGSTLTVSLTVTAVREDCGAITGFIGIARDVTESRAAAAARREAERRFKAAFEHAPIGVAITGLQGRARGRFLQTNPALNALVGCAPGELDGAPSSAITHPDDVGATEEALDQLARGESVTFEKRYLHRAGHEIAMLISVTPIPEEGDARPRYCVAQCINVSESKQFEEQLRHIADHDVLTGLANRQRFESELQRTLAETRRYGRAGALLLLDLDGFKHVNDQFGHPVGDELVARVGGVLASSVRATDVVARVGGDEFAIILQEVQEADAVAVARKIVEAIRQYGVVLHGLQHARVTTSVGVTTFDAAIERTSEELIVEADNAMYEAKAAGRDGYRVYRRGTDRRQVLTRHDSWLQRLRDALERDRFVLHAQPIRPICAEPEPWYELLLRLRNERDELIAPAAFLHNAERFDVMGEIDRWVLCRAVTLLHEHHRAGGRLRLAVNLSGLTMNDVSLAEDLARMLAARPIPDGALVVEVTETAAIGNIARAGELARDLRALGCHVALDDFGSGFASFSYLKHLNFDYVKIDGEYVRQMTATRSDQVVVRAVVDIAKGLGAQTVAEFVGDEPTVEMLRGFGVEYGQGFHLGRPGPLAHTLPPLRCAAA